MYLIKEQFGVSEKKIIEALNSAGIDHLDLLEEDSKWFVLEDGRLSPGSYKVSTDKVINTTCDDIVNRKDVVIADQHCYPVGDIMGMSVYEMTHKRTQQKVYVTIGELLL